MPLQSSRKHERLSRQLRAFFLFLARKRQTSLAQIVNEFAIVRIAEELNDALGDSRPDFVYFLEFFGRCLHDRIERTEMFCQKLRGTFAHEPDAESEDDTLQRQRSRLRNLTEYIF